MRIAVVQTNPVFGEVNGNVDDALALMETASADLYVLPELFSTGYNFIDEPEVRRLAETADGLTFRKMNEWTKNHSCSVVYGFAEKADKIYNSAAFVGPGRIGRDISESSSISSGEFILRSGKSWFSGFQSAVW